MTKKLEAQKVYYKILPRVAKGTVERPNIGGSDDKLGKQVFRWKLVLKDGFDKGGAFWGTDVDVFAEFTLDQTYVHFSKKAKKTDETKYKSGSVFIQIMKTVKFVDSQLGRPNIGSEKDVLEAKMYVYGFEVKLNDKNKDIGGVTWPALGSNEKLYAYFTLDLTYVEFKKVSYGNPPPIFNTIKEFYREKESNDAN